MVDTIPFTRLLYLLLPLLATAYFYYRWTDQKWELAYATLRMIVQLIAIGYALVFLFQDESYGMGLAVILVMMAMSSWIAIRPIQRQKRALLSPTLLAVGLSGTVMLFLLIGPVLALDPLYQPRLVIPLAGMIYSNAMNTISLAGERYFTECDSGISSDRARSQAYRAALIPKVNSFLAVGLVSLPGMMTGQILSGISPLIAVRYQIMVMAMIFGTAGLSAAIFLYLVRKTK